MASTFYMIHYQGIVIMVYRLSTEVILAGFEPTVGYPLSLGAESCEITVSNNFACIVIRYLLVCELPNNNGLFPGHRHDLSLSSGFMHES